MEIGGGGMIDADLLRLRVLLYFYKAEENGPTVTECAKSFQTEKNHSRRAEKQKQDERGERSAGKPDHHTFRHPVFIVAPLLNDVAASYWIRIYIVPTFFIFTLPLFHQRHSGFFSYNRVGDGFSIRTACRSMPPAPKPPGRSPAA